MTTCPQCIVVTDANVLINLMRVHRLEMCSRLPNLKFVVPDHVREEITDIAQRAEIDDAIARGDIRMEAITTPSSIDLFAELISHIGRGEAACIALAVEHGWILASDEKKRFRREAEARIGMDRIMGTKELYLLAIGASLLSVDEADADKAVLEQHRFTMDFKSFRDLVR